MAIPAQEAWPGGDTVICKLVAEDGSAGLGEVFVWLPESGILQNRLSIRSKKRWAATSPGKAPSM
jgi:hypothetical protein